MLLTVMGESRLRDVEVARCIKVPSMIVNFAARVARAIMLKYLRESKISFKLVLNDHERCRSSMVVPLLYHGGFSLDSHFHDGNKRTYSVFLHHAIATPLPICRQVSAEQCVSEIMRDPPSTYQSPP